MSSNRIDSGNFLNVNQTSAGLGANDEQTVITVRLPDATPSREEIARAVFESFGFGPQDAAFLRQRFQTDPVQYFADTFRLDPRSVSRAADGTTTIRISLSSADVQRLQTLAAERQQPLNLFTSPLSPGDTWATRNVYDPTQTLRTQLCVAPTPVQTTTITPQPTADTRNEEGVGAFFEGAIAGDFSENQSWSKTGGQVVVGVIPIVGQIADARDTVAAVRDIWEGREGGWVNLGAAALGWIPLVGDAAKGAIRVGRKVVTEGGQELAERTVRETVTSIPPSTTNLVPSTSAITPNSSTLTNPATVPGTNREYGVFFFGDDVLPYVDQTNATLGRNGRQHFFMPLEDATGITNAADAARQSGHAPSILNAYINGTPAYGVSFPTNGLTVRVPTAQDANGWAHFLEGGRTAVRTSDPNGGYLLNSTREFVTPGGNLMPPGSVLFRIDEGGAWTPIRRFP